MNKKKIILITSLIIILIIIAIITSVSKIENQSHQSTSPLTLISVNPSEDPNGLNQYSPIKPIIFTFDKPINNKTLSIMNTPSLPLKIDLSSDKKNITVRPNPPDFWKPNTVYTIVISKGLKSTDDATLKEDITYKIQSKLQGGE